MPKRAPWYSILLVARTIVKEREILTSSSLAKKADIPVNVASAWLGKFYRWGYALKSGIQRSKGRPAYIWGLTDWGMRYKVGKKMAKPPLRIAANPPGNQG